MKNFLLILVALFTLSLNPVLSQTDNSVTDSTIVITMNDGVVRIGTVISDDGREVHFMDNKIGEIYISKEEIKSMVPFSQSAESLEQKSDEFTGPEGPFTTRYYFTTNALPIKKSENYAMVHLYGPELHFAVSDRLSIGVMTTWIASPFVVVGKYTIPTKKEKVNLGIGTMMGSSGYLNTFRGWGGMHWGMITIGDRLKNITISAGYSYANPGNKYPQTETTYDKPGSYPAITDNFGNTNFDNNIPTITDPVKSMSSAPVIGIAGIARIGKKASFIFDSMIFLTTLKKGSATRRVYGHTSPNDPLVSEVTAIGGGRGAFGFLMPGMRFQSKPSRAFQFSLAGTMWLERNKTSNSLDLKGFPMPMVSWFFKF